MLLPFLRSVMSLGASMLLLGVAPAVADAPIQSIEPTIHQTFDDQSADVLWKASQYSNGPGKNEFSLSNVSMDNGGLSLIVSQNKRIGGEVVAPQDTSYGYYETRMKCSPVSGIVCAFFWVGDYGEIDVELLSNDDSSAHLVFHKQDGTSDYYQHPLPVDFDMSEFHRYGFIYAPDTITWTIDGEAVHWITIDNLPDTGRITLNAWAGHEYWGEGPPTEDATSVFDYVKFYEGATTIVQAI